MRKINSIQELNDVMKVYLARLLNEDPVLLDHIELFRNFAYDFIYVCDNTIIPDANSVEVFKKSFEQIRTESPMTTLELVKKYFSETYNGLYDSQIERALVDGTINITTLEEKEFEDEIHNRKISELEFEIKELENKIKFYDFNDENSEKRKKWLLFQIRKRESEILFLKDTHRDLYDNQVTSYENLAILNCLFLGNIYDGYNLVHEIRHLLNLPPDKKKRKFLSKISTEGLSFCDGLNYIDFLSGIYPEEELNILRKKVFYDAYTGVVKFNWEALLVEIYESYGSVSAPNYAEYCLEEDLEAFENKFFEESFFGMLSRGNSYVFGINLASYLRYKFKENPDFISTFVSLNEEIRNNPTVYNGQDVPTFFNKIGLNLETDEPFLKYTASELEYIMSRDNVPEIKM